MSLPVQAAANRHQHSWDLGFLATLVALVVDPAIVAEEAAGPAIAAEEAAVPAIAAEEAVLVEADPAIAAAEAVLVEADPAIAAPEADLAAAAAEIVVAAALVAAALVAAVRVAIASVVAVLAVLALGQGRADSVAVCCRAILVGLGAAACHLLSLTIGPRVCRAFGPDRQIFATLFALIFPGTVPVHCSRYSLKLAYSLRPINSAQFALDRRGAKSNKS
jgi:hypothetical protein